MVPKAAQAKPVRLAGLSPHNSARCMPPPLAACRTPFHECKRARFRNKCTVPYKLRLGHPKRRLMAPTHNAKPWRACRRMQHAYQSNRAALFLCSPPLLTPPIALFLHDHLRHKRDDLQRKGLKEAPQITLAIFLSLSTSSATSATLMPALRLGGSATLRVFRRGATSTPSSAGVVVAISFFLAFIMLGNVT